MSGTHIRYWWKNNKAITNSPELHLRVTGGGRHPRLGVVEDVLIDQIVFMRSKKKEVSHQWIQACAHQLAEADLDDDDVCSSYKWLAHFMTRYELSV